MINCIIDKGTLISYTDDYKKINYHKIAASLARLALAALVIGLPAFIMGGTLPAAARAVTAEDDGNRRSLGTLYGLNTIGALTDVLLSRAYILHVGHQRHQKLDG